MEEIFISGQIGKAVYRERGKYFLLEVEDREPPVECRSGDLSAFFGSGAEIVSLDAKDHDLSKARKKLESERSAHRALFLATSGMDGELSNETRSFSIEAAEELFQDGFVFSFVRSRFLARPLSPTADLEGGIKIAGSLEARGTGSLYRELNSCAGAIPVVLDTWEEVWPDFFASEEEMRTGEAALVEAGVFADMAKSVFSKDVKALNLLVVDRGSSPVLKGRLPNAVHVINAIKSGILKKAGVSFEKVQEKREEREAVPLEDIEAPDPIRELIASFMDVKTQKHRRGDYKKYNSIEAKERVSSQIAAIEKYIQRGNIHQAKKYLLELIEFNLKHGKKTHTAKTLCSLSKTALDFRHFDFAGELVEYAFMLEVEDAVIWNSKAQVFKGKGDLEGALGIYDETVNRFPDNAVARNGRAEVLKEMGRYEEALKEYEGTVRDFGNDVFARNGRAEVLKEMGRYEEALKEYDDTVRDFENNAVARNGRAKVLKEMGRYEEALKEYNNTVRDFENNVVARTGRAEVLKEMGRYEEALKEYEGTVRDFENNVVARTGRAEVLKEMGRYEEALKKYNDTVRDFENNVFARTGRAEVLREMGRYEEALKEYDDTVRDFENDVVARTGRAEVLKEMGRYEEALKEYDDTVRDFENDVVARTGRICLLMLMGKFEEAVPHLYKGVPESGQDWINYHISAMHYLKRGDVGEAVRRLEYGVENCGIGRNRNFFVSALAVALLKKEMFEKAEKVLMNNVADLDAFQRRKRLALLGHSQAGLNHKKDALHSLAEIGKAYNPHILKLKDCLIRRYNLSGEQEAPLSPSAQAELDGKIEEEEFFLALSIAA